VTDAPATVTGVPDVAAAPRAPRELWLLLVLGALSAFGPLSLDMYLPAFPAIAADLGTGASQVQLTLTSCLIGLAVGQLIAGPLSDRFGRKPPLLVGVGGYAIASLLCAFAPDPWTLTGLRVLQGLAGSAGIVIARAVARDLHSGPSLARFFALLMLVNGTAPILAPLLGAQVLRFTSWRGVFVVLAVIGLLIWLAVLLVLPETLPPERRHGGGVAETVGTFGTLLSERAFVGVALSTGFVMGAMFAYIAGSSFVLQQVYGLSPQQFAVVFGSNAAGLIAASQVSAVLVRRVPPRTLLRTGVTTSAVGGVALLVCVQAGAGLVGVLASLFLVVLSVGLVAPNAAALALADHPRNAGSASALLGLMQFAVGGLLAPLVGLGGERSLAYVIAGSSVAAAIVFAVMLHGRGTRHRHPADAQGILKG
jgi:DHA1 family bicyclomycin/chloramphenicol resistance-like MFS transporter